MNLPWAELLLASLRDAGCGDLVVSPGSRSTPLVMAAARLGLGCQVLIDERVAGFFALGRGRASGRPSALVCTSGTAAAHYLPAVVEASQARVPLVVVTADRPPELHGCAAPQTIDQQHLFGRFARGFVDLGVPEAEAGALRGLRRRAAQMVALAMGPEPGPVHINVPARKPLEPTGSREEARMAALVAELSAAPIVRAVPPVVSGGEEAVGEIVQALGRARRALLVAGPAPLDQPAGPIAELARASGLPLLAEVTSQLRFTGEEPAAGLCDHFDFLLRAPGWSAAHQPDLIVELGAPPTSSAYAAMVAAAGCERIVIAPHGWSDPHGTARLLVQAPVAEVARRVAARAKARPGSWTEDWLAGNRRAGAALDRLALTGEHAAVRAAITALPDGALLVLGNSLPVRTAESSPPLRRRIGVLAQRGACGIDGLIAGAAGAASATRRPTALILGDVSFAHDLGGLAAARLAGAPLAIVVIDNRGGRIFEQLPVARAPGGAEILERFFITPPAIDVAAAAAAFGLTAVRSEDPAGAVAAALAGDGAPAVIHVPVPPHSARDLEAAVVTEVDR